MIQPSHKPFYTVCITQSVLANSAHIISLNLVTMDTPTDSPMGVINDYLLELYQEKKLRKMLRIIFHMNVDLRTFLSLYGTGIRHDVQDIFGFLGMLHKEYEFKYPADLVKYVASDVEAAEYQSKVNEHQETVMRQTASATPPPTMQTTESNGSTFKKWASFTKSSTSKPVDSTDSPTVSRPPIMPPKAIVRPEVYEIRYFLESCLNRGYRDIAFLYAVFIMDIEIAQSLVEYLANNHDEGHEDERLFIEKCVECLKSSKVDGYVKFVDVLAISS